MPRYVGASVATALAATIYGTVGANQREAGESAASALSSALAAASWVMAVFTRVGLVLTIITIVRRPVGPATMQGMAAAAAAVVHTVPGGAQRSSSARDVRSPDDS